MRVQHTQRRQACDHCGGRFGLVTHRWWGNKFCKRTCRDYYIREVALDRDAIRRWLWLARLPSRAGAAGPSVPARSVTYGAEFILAPFVRPSGKPLDVMTRNNGAAPMLQIILFLIALLLHPAAVARADSGYCGHTSELASARLRWQAARQIPIDPALADKNCRAFGNQFYEAVTARQATSACHDGIDHQRDLVLLDSEIEAFNKLIAAQCGG
jgi:hypothetical protein